MTKTKRIEKEIWTTGRRGQVACIQAIQYENGAIVASAEDDAITDTQFRRALGREYPQHYFQVRREDGYVYGRSSCKPAVPKARDILLGGYGLRRAAAEGR